MSILKVLGECILAVIQLYAALIPLFHSVQCGSVPLSVPGGAAAREKHHCLICRLEMMLNLTIMKWRLSVQHSTSVGQYLS